MLLFQAKSAAASQRTEDSTMSPRRCLLLAVLLAAIAFGKIAKADVDDLRLLKSGETRLCKYQLVQVGAVHRDACDLLLIVKNAGAKFIDAEPIWEQKLVVRDVDGKEIKSVVMNPLRSLAFGGRSMLHISLSLDRLPRMPYSLELDTGAKRFVRLQLTIDDIRLNPVHDEPAAAK